MMTSMPSPDFYEFILNPERAVVPIKQEMNTKVGTIDPLIETRLAQFLEADLIKNPKRMRPSPINSNCC